jgi:hypothetical protein
MYRLLLARALLAYSILPRAASDGSKNDRCTPAVTSDVGSLAVEADSPRRPRRPTVGALRQADLSISAGTLAPLRLLRNRSRSHSKFFKENMLIARSRFARSKQK